MDNRRRTLSSEDVRLLKQTIRRVNGGKGSARPLPTRRRNRSAAGSSGAVIYAQVNKVTNVGTGEPNFPFDNAMPVVGQIPSGGTGTAQNQYAQAYLDNEWVFLFENKLTGQWLTERGGLSGSQVVTFELTQDMSYADVSTLAVPVLADGTADFAADEFWVVDIKGQFYGKTATGGEDGYRGYALRFTDDWNSSGVPGFRIMDMEGPMHWFIATLTEAWSSGSTNCSVGPDQIWGRPDRGVRLPAEGDVAVYDDLDVAVLANIGDVWLVAWDEAEEHYIFVLPIRADSPMIPAVAMITTTCPAMNDAFLDGTAKTASPGVSSDTAATILKWDTNLPPTLGPHPDYDPMAVLNLSETELTATTSKAGVVGGYIQKFHDPDGEEGEETVYMFVVIGPRDIRILGGFDLGTKQIPYHDAASANEILDGEDCPEE